MFGLTVTFAEVHWLKVLVMSAFVFCFLFFFLDRRFGVSSSSRKRSPARALLIGLAEVALIAGLGLAFITFQLHSHDSSFSIELTGAILIAFAADQVVIMGKRMRNTAEIEMPDSHQPESGT